MFLVCSSKNIYDIKSWSLDHRFNEAAMIGGVVRKEKVIAWFWNAQVQFFLFF